MRSVVLLNAIAPEKNVPFICLIKVTRISEAMTKDLRFTG